MKYKKIKNASILCITGNLILSIIKGIIGFITKSNSMISDAFNSISDVITSILTIIGTHISSKEADEDHNLGHGKAEYIFSLIISIIMIYISIKLIINSFTSLVIENEYKFSIWLIIICLITIFIKLLLYIYTHKLNKKYNNILMYSLSSDQRNDMILACFTLFANICAFMGYNKVDSIVGIFLAIFILLSGIEIFKKSYDVLMDKSLDQKTIEKIKKIALSHKEVIKINHLNTTPIGDLYQVSITIFVDGDMTTFKSHQIADKIEDEITELDKVYLTIVHVNPTEIKEK